MKSGWRPVRITLDGIAKGYAVDCAVRALKQCRVPAAWVNAGGDIRAYGPLTLPVFRRDGDGSLRQLGGLRDAAIATSEVRTRADARFPGTIVASEGVPVHAGTWTVLAHTAWRADALTKVAALAQPALRASLLARLGGALVNESNRLH
jgi:thiamine biosynthesis lipoprotein